MNTAGFWMSSPGSPWCPRFLSKEPGTFYWLLVTPLSEEDLPSYRVASYRNLPSLMGGFRSQTKATREVLLALYCAPEFHGAYSFRWVEGEGVTHCYKYGLPEFLTPPHLRALDAHKDATLAALNAHPPHSA